jgi:tetratricopeptide (TPR) repeat protein
MRDAARQAVGRGEKRPARAEKPGPEKSGDGRRTTRYHAEPAVRTEILRLGGTRGEALLERLIDAAGALDRGRERDAVRMLKRLRDELPDAASVRELLGIALYRLGRYEEGRRELDTFVGLTGSVEQHPVLMDCLRALRRYRRLDTLWEELRAASPSGDIVTEGRIVVAGALADRGRLGDAIQLLEKGPLETRRVRPYHLRLWYVLADLEERGGNLARARSLFERVRANDPAFIDVGARLSALA